MITAKFVYWILLCAGLFPLHLDGLKTVIQVEKEEDEEVEAQEEEDA